MADEYRVSARFDNSHKRGTPSIEAVETTPLIRMSYCNVLTSGKTRQAPCFVELMFWGCNERIHHPTMSPTHPG